MQPELKWRFYHGNRLEVIQCHYSIGGRSGHVSSVENVKGIPIMIYHLFISVSTVGVLTKLVNERG